MNNKQIKISINDVSKTVSSQSSLQQVIEILELASGDFVIAINQQFVPRSQYESTEVKENDRIELLAPMVGG